MKKLYITDLRVGYERAFQEGFAWVDAEKKLASATAVAIKPNLTFPTFRKGVMTNPEALEALVVHLKNYTDRITICESDSGGYNKFSMDEVFRATGIDEMARRYGVRVVNMSYEPSRTIKVGTKFRSLKVPLPTLLLDETDLFMTLPVPKVHCNAIVSLSIKNQWGVIQSPSLRLKLHPYFKEVIYAVNKSLPPAISIVDGKYGLTRNGPMKGDVVDLNWLLMADDLFIADYVVTMLMGFDYRRIPYLKYIFAKEEIENLDGVDFNADYREFQKEPFYLKRAWTDYPGVSTFNSRSLAYIGYESFLAKPLHWLLYKFREPFY